MASWRDPAEPRTLELDLMHKHATASSRCRSPAEQRSPHRVVTPVG